MGFSLPSDLDLLEQKEECLEYYLDEAFHDFVSDNDDILHLTDFIIGPKIRF